MSQDSKPHQNNLTSAILSLSPVGISGISAALILVCYGVARLLFGTDPSAASFIGVLAFVLGAVAVLIRTGRRTYGISKEENVLLGIGIVLMTTATLYAVSLSAYMGTGKLLGTVIGALAGALAFAGRRQRSLLVHSRYISNVVWGVLVFVLMRESMVDVLSMGSMSLEPRIHKNDKILVTYASFGVRMPFTPRNIVRWGEPKVGDLVIVRGRNDAPFLREVLDVNATSLLVNVDGWVPKETLLGKATRINKPVA